MGRECAAQVGEMRNAYTVFAGNPEERYQFGYLIVDGRMILKRILMK
jgi:hypothetical protein